MNEAEQLDFERIKMEAAAWTWKSERGLTSAEQDQLSQWLAADRRHGAELSRVGRNWSRLDELIKRRPEQAAVVGRNFPPSAWVDSAPSGKRRRAARIRRAALSLAAAAAAAAVFWASRHGSKSSERHSPAGASWVPMIAEIEDRILPDGSVIELNHGAEVSVHFTSKERRVDLVRGEAHFKVAKNPLRPFVVDASGVLVRAVGTAFDVRLGAGDVEILVTEGRVQVRPSAGAPFPFQPLPAKPRQSPTIETGERAIVPLGPVSSLPQIVRVSPADIERTLAWEPQLLDFTGAPVADIVADFNRHNPVKLVIEKPGLASLRMSACLRSDNIDGFVRLLEAGFGVRAERHGQAEILLKEAP